MDYPFTKHMKLKKLYPCTLIKRYKRFLADVYINKKKETIYVPNTGPILGVYEEGYSCLYSLIDKPKKMDKKLEIIIQPNGIPVGINTHNPNRIVEDELLKPNNKLLKCHSLKREFSIKNSKFDFLINENILLEIKNVSGVLPSSNTAFFPDTKSERALKHLRELISLKENGFKPYLFFIIQRDDVEHFTPGYEFHPEYAKELSVAYSKKLINIKAFSCKIEYKKDFSINIHKEIPIIIQNN